MPRAVRSEASFVQAALWAAEGAAFRSVMAGFGALGIDCASDTGAAIARTLGPRLPLSRRAERNLARAMPELAPAQRAAIITGMWDNLGRTLAEYPHLDAFTREPWRLEMAGEHHAAAAVAEGRGAIFVSGHFANWEVMPLVSTRNGWAAGGIYRAPNNPHVHHWIMQRRRSHIMPTQIPKGASGVRDIFAVLKAGGCIAMLADQKMNDGIATTFFGRTAMTAAAPAQIAHKLGCPIVPCWIERTGTARFRMTVYPAMQVDQDLPRADAIPATMEAINRFLEDRIRARPEGWLWLHNRWGKG